MRCFISYNSQDGSVAKVIAAELQQRGVSVWYAPERIGAGQFFAAEIVPAIERCETVLLMASQHSIGCSKFALAGSKHVARELQLADKHGKPIIPLALDSVLSTGPAEGFAYLLALNQYLDLRAHVHNGQWSEAADLIKRALDNGPVAAQTRQGGEQRLQIEALLAQGQGREAAKRLAVAAFAQSDPTTHRWLSLIARLQHQSIAELGKREADELVRQLQALHDSPLAASALFVLALLSQHYYVPKGLVDPTGGAATLQQTAHAQGHRRPPARHLAMLEHVFPQVSVMARRWGRVTPVHNERV